ncbi:MAG: putative mismatch endonuclease [Rhodocyclales bacterium]|nr:putative mismatch endonuclease [Rhodocyclales bacterium]
MTDVVDPATRSRMMSGIRGKNTRPEVFLRKGLHALGFRFRLHAKDIPGKPDIVLPKYKALIVVHGCFWHGHDCRYFRLPGTRQDFWLEKIESNRKRDERDAMRQLEEGWRILIVWECAIRASMKARPGMDVVSLTTDWLRNNQISAVIDENGIRGS